MSDIILQPEGTQKPAVCDMEGEGRKRRWPRIPAETKLALIKYLSSGTSRPCTDIAAQFGVSKDTVWRLREQINAAKHKKRGGVAPAPKVQPRLRPVTTDPLGRWWLNPNGGAQ